MAAQPPSGTTGRRRAPSRQPSRADRPERTQRPARPRRPDTRQTSVRSERPVRVPQPRSKPASVRGRRIRRPRPMAATNSRFRGRLALIVLLGVLAVASVKLVSIQAIDTADYAAKSEAQRTRTIKLLAERGTVTDRNGAPLAFTVEGRAIAARPALFTDDDQRRQVADVLVAETTAAGVPITADDVLGKLTSGRSYVYLARNLMPAQADAIMEKVGPLFDDDHVDAVVTERQDLREYPNGSASAAIVGGTDYDGNGLSGVEAKFDTKLRGKDGSRTVDVDARHAIIPGSARDETDAVNGMDVQLTIDSDLQYTVMSMLSSYVDASAANSGCIVVMTVKDAQIPAMACYEPGKTPKETGNRAVTDAIEPGSVNKVVAFAAALEKGVIKPDTVMTVDGSIDFGDATIHDAWGHGPIDMSATGIIAKSSNVGTLMIAKQVGEDDFIAMAERMGQGTKAGVQLPAESSGRFPPRSSWSVSTFGNLPIGQGVSMTLVQLAGMYQSIANGGVRVAPTIVAGTTVDGVTTPTAPGASTQAMSPTTAHTLLDMLRGTVQDGDTNHRGTAPQAAITGYQVAGKTGTAQKVDESIGDYSQTAITSTFAGIVPADNPQYVVTIMLDDPKGGSAGTTSAAPLFHDVAAYAMRAAAVPPSPTEAPVYDLYVG